MGFLCRRKKHSTIATANASFSKEKEGGENNSGENSSGSPVVDLNGVDAKMAAGDRRSSKMDCSNGPGNDEVVVNNEEMVNGDVKKTGKSVEADDMKDSNPLNSSQKTKVYSKSNLSKAPHHPPNLNDNKNPGYSKLSSFASRRKSPPIFDYELDENSEAGISAAALKKALEQAQKTITIVKMIKEKEKEKEGLKGGSKPKANSSLDVKDNKQTVDENFGEIFNEFVQQEETENKSENISILGDDFVDVKKSAGFCDAEETNESDENRDGFEFREAGFEESIDEDDDAYSNNKETFIGSKLYIALESLSSDGKTEENDEISSKTAIEIHNAAKIDMQSLRHIEQTSTHEPQECAENATNMTSNNEKEYSDEIDKSSVDNDTKMPTKQEKNMKKNEQMFDTNDMQQRIEAIKKGREREKERKAVERAIREARERAFAEAQERAAIEAKLKAERIAVERATKEARERALEKSISQRENGLKQSFSSSDMDKVDRDCSESAQRRKARLERHQRIMDRAAKALAEKNMRDLLVQREQAERNRLSQYLDAEITRWATGKEGNIRALLSTLQYILGRDSGWKTISLTEIVTNVAVKKAYRKATLYLHPDKLQQRGANVRQKYICEKVFELLKAAWNRFNSEGR